MNRVILFDEILAVGIIDWLWFVFYLNRNEFSPKLDLFCYKGTNAQLSAARKRAHRVDEKLSELKWKQL